MPVIQKTYLSTNRDIAQSTLTNIVDSLLNLLFPDVCLLCSAQVSRWRDRSICLDCRNKAGALRIFPPVCPSCGLPMSSFQADSGCLCGDCILEPPAFSGARSFGYYIGELAMLARELKFHKRRNLTDLLVPFLFHAFQQAWDRDDFDTVTPVPLHPDRERKRGYNQAGLLARSLASRIGIPYRDRLLIRKRSTLPQTGLTDSQRSANVRNAFGCVDPGQIAGRRILLIDDVMTTGATVSSASEALIRSGALRVSVLTLARTVAA